MDVVKEIADVRRLVAAARQRGCGIGCVPTMGALHPGHLSLIEECRKRVEFVVVWIYVNPTQFAPTEDLDKYPRPLEADLQACREAGVDCVFLPDDALLYPPGYETWVTVENMSKILEGEFRPTHFRGVTTIVTKLLNIIQPDVACFGSKDYQQQTMIRRMVRDLNIPVEIVVCPTIREPDGLAMSSRNVYLSPEERQQALILFQTLEGAEKRLRSGAGIADTEAWMWAQLESQSDVRPQYAVLRDPETLAELTKPQQNIVALIAAHVGQTRLIDHRTIHLDEVPIQSS